MGPSSSRFQSGCSLDFVLGDRSSVVSARRPYAAREAIAARDPRLRVRTSSKMRDTGFTSTRPESRWSHFSSLALPRAAAGGT